MSSIGNNTNGKYSQLRDAFFGTNGFTVSSNMKGNGEVDYLKELLTKYPKAREIFSKLKKLPVDVLYKEAKKRLDMIENGQVRPEDLGKIEGEIALLLAAIEDMEMVLEHIRYPMPEDDEMGNGR